MEQLDRSLGRAFTPDDRRPTYEWAADNVQLPPSITRQGAFDLRDTRHLIGPFEALDSEFVRQEVLMAPIRGAKSLIGDIFLCSCIVRDPGPFMWVAQKDDVVEDYALDRIHPTIERCPKAKALLPEGRQQTTEIRFLNGMVLYLFGPSLTNLQNKGIRYMVIDEGWLIAKEHPGRINEAKGRLGDFEEIETSKLFMPSQAGSENDDFDLEYQKGTQSEWHVECQRCGHYQIPRLTGRREDGSLWGLVWDKHRTSKGEWEIGKCLPTVRFECQKCAHPHVDERRTKHEWNRTGKYVAQNPNAARAYSSHRYSGLITRNWSAMAEEYLSAMNAYKLLGNVMPLIQFFQKRMAEPKSEGAILEGQSEFTRLAYEVRSTWEDEVFRFMTIDRQEDCFYYVVRAWSKSGESRRLAFGKVFSFQDLEVVREANKVDPRRTFCDSGYMPKGDNGVYTACHRYGWIALKGDKQDTYWHEEPIGGRKVRVCHSYSDFQFMDGASGTSGQGRAVCKHIIFSATIMADRLKGLIEKGKWVEPAVNLEDEKEKDYNSQMHSERKAQKRNKITNRVEWIWVKTRDANHYWDCGKMQVCVATACRILPDVLDTTDSAQATTSAPLQAT